MTKPKKSRGVALRCIGCGAEFSSSEAFDVHATGSRRAPIGTPRRCRTAAEMIALGLHQTDEGRRWALRAPRA